MRWLTPLAVTVEKILDRVLCIAGAVLGAQLPEFMQQYLQRLGGQLDEARRWLENFARVARMSGLTLEQYIARLTGNSDVVVARTGGVVRDLAARVDALATAEAALRGASPWARPGVFLRQVDGEIAAATWAVFKPAVPTTVEGVAYAVAGLLAALALYHGAVRWPVRRAWRARVARMTAAGGLASVPPGPEKAGR